MWHPETDQRPDTAQARAIVLHGEILHGDVSYGDRADRLAPPLRGRPLAGFLAQLIVSADPTLRPSRLDRTQEAAARYAETARVRL